MARQKKPVHKVQMTEGKRNIIHQLLEAIQSALAGKDIDATSYPIIPNPSLSFLNLRPTSLPSSLYL